VEAAAAEEQPAVRDLPRDREPEPVGQVKRVAMAAGATPVTGRVTMVQAPATEMAISPIPETVVETSTAERDQVPATAERITAMVVRRTGTATSNKRAAAHSSELEGVAVVASPLPSPSLDER